MNPFGGPGQPIPIGILPDLGQDLADGRFHPTVVHGDLPPMSAFGRSGNLARIDVGFADLGFDLVDQATNVVGQPPCAHDGDGTASRWRPPTDRLAMSDQVA
jgi:hypothetical protein